MEEKLQHLAEHLEDMPVFPLPNVVFFPHTKLPLHIFEPRYREMTADALEQGLPIAMAQIDVTKPTDEHGRPAIHDVVGAGFIGKHQKLPDGRYFLELDGVARLRVLKEHQPDKSYRRIQAEILGEHGEDGTKEQVETLHLFTATLRQINSEAADFIHRILAGSEDASSIADQIANALIGEADVRQALLRNLDIGERLAVVSDRLSEILARTAVAPDDQVN